MTTLRVLYEYPQRELIHRYETRYIINVLRERSCFLNASHGLVRNANSSWKWATREAIPRSNVVPSYNVNRRNALRA